MILNFYVIRPPSKIEPKALKAWQNALIYSQSMFNYYILIYVWSSSKFYYIIRKAAKKRTSTNGQAIKRGGGEVKAGPLRGKKSLF